MLGTKSVATIPRISCLGHVATYIINAIRVNVESLGEAPDIKGTANKNSHLPLYV